VFGWRSVRGRAALAGAVFVLLLAAMVAVAVWRAHDDRERHRSLERGSTVVSALEGARAEWLLAGACITASALADDPVPLLELHRQATLAAREDLDRARAGLIALGDKDEVAALDELAQQIDQLAQTLDTAWVPSLGADWNTRIERARQLLPTLAPLGQTMVTGLEQLTEGQQDKLAAERAAADRAADATLTLLIALGLVALLGGAATMVIVILSVVRPLASLRKSVRAIASGDLQTRAKVSGPEEVASLARDFNEMVTARGLVEEALRETDLRYRTLFDRSQDAIYMHDFEGRLLDANDAALRLLGYSRDDILKLSLADLLDESQLPTAVAAVDEIMKTGTQATPTTYRLRRKDGAFVEVETLAAALHEEGRLVAIQGMARDVTERKQMEEALRESEARYKALFAGAPEGMLVADLQTKQFLYANPAICRMFGYTEEEFLRLGVADIHPKESLDYVLADFEAQARGEKLLSPDLPCQRKDGSLFYANISAIMVVLDGRKCNVGIFTDVTERKRMEEALREQARRDPLTGVLNHGAIVAELRRLISSGDRGTSHTVAMVDVDGLKATNDAYGHQVGDAVLRAVAGALSRDGALVGRYGGDEFVAILPGASRQQAERYQAAVVETLASAGLTEPEMKATVPVVVSIGLAAYPTEAARVEELIRLADSEMYAAKRQRPFRRFSLSATDPLDADRAARMLGEIVPLLTSPGELNDKLQLVAHRLAVGAGYDGVHFEVLRHPSGVRAGQSAFARVPGELVGAWNREQRQFEDHPLREIIERTRCPIIFDDVQNDQRLTDAERELLRAGGLRSALLAPMFWQDELLGHLAVASKREAAFGPRDAQFLMAVATQTTAVVRMATLVEELQSASDRLVQAHTETVMLLAASAEAHDHATGLHLENVRAITEALARELNYREEEAKELGLAAVLHDIGKVRVPDSLLISKGTLADEEWELMKHHTTWGAEFLAGRPGLELAGVIARSHHEHWDGSGYPDGLAGEAIPEAAAIVAVADAFDAMTSNRPYRAARSVAAAVREIVACSGKQFSPRVVRALVRLHKRRTLPHSRQHALEQQAVA
jgi:diguanylate cyclase (GGDEF)-like protein/PAS domain S-box-containing protein